MILVTSASHMRRAVLMFQKVGLDPHPAPADHRVMRGNQHPLLKYLPSAGALQKSRRAIYEYMGLTWAKLRGHID